MQEFRSQANLQKLQQKQAPTSGEDGFEGGVVRPREWSFARGMLYSVSLLTTVGKRIFLTHSLPTIIPRPRYSGNYYKKQYQPKLYYVVLPAGVPAVICALEKFHRTVRPRPFPFLPSLLSSHIRTIDPICIQICRLPSAPMGLLSSRSWAGKIPLMTIAISFKL